MEPICQKPFRDEFCQLASFEIHPILISMKLVSTIKETWLTKKPSWDGWFSTMLLVSFLLLASMGFLMDTFHARDWMPASAELVFIKKEVWRLWTTLFAHGDLGHLMSNAFLLIPLSFLLSGYFGYFLFPLIGLLIGGIINFFVLLTLPENSYLIGISGVVYWMASAWLTLYLLIDRRHSWKFRFAVSVCLAVMLLAPETYKPEISYLSHFLGFVFGVFSGGIYFLMNRNKFRNAEVIEYHIEDDLDQNQVTFHF